MVKYFISKMLKNRQIFYWGNKEHYSTSLMRECLTSCNRVVHRLCHQKLWNGGGGEITLAWKKMKQQTLANYYVFWTSFHKFWKTRYLISETLVTKTVGVTKKINKVLAQLRLPLGNAEIDCDLNATIILQHSVMGINLNTAACDIRKMDRASWHNEDAWHDHHFTIQESTFSRQFPKNLLS